MLSQMTGWPPLWWPDETPLHTHIHRLPVHSSIRQRTTDTWVVSESCLAVVNSAALNVGVQVARLRFCSHFLRIQA